jgi:hypothetical protein
MKANNVLENEELEITLGKENFLKYIAKLGAEKNSLHIISNYLVDTSKRVTLLTATSFLKSNELVIKFLNSGSQKAIALKGIPGVYEEFFMDGHPKAVGVSEIHLREAGIEIPSEGYIDSRSLDQDSINELKSKIRLLKNYLSDETLEGVMQLEKYKFQSIKDIKQNIENFSIYSNAHVFDLRIMDKKGKEKIIPTCGYSPVIPRGIRIVGVGPETLEKWGKVLKVTDLLITVGDVSLYTDILCHFNGNEIVAINI